MSARGLKLKVHLFELALVHRFDHGRFLLRWASGLDTQARVFEGDATHPPLFYQEMITVLPFQVSATRFVVAYYIMNYASTRPFPDMSVRLTLGNLPDGEPTVALLFDPISNQYFLGQKLKFLEGGITISAEAKDYPRLIILDHSRA